MERNQEGSKELAQNEIIILEAPGSFLIMKLTSKPGTKTKDFQKAWGLERCRISGISEGSFSGIVRFR